MPIAQTATFVMLPYETNKRFVYGERFKKQPTPKALQ